MGVPAVKYFARPKKEPTPPGRPMIAGYPTFNGMWVDHPKHGPGTLQWCEFRLFDGSWVMPLERDVHTGHWIGIVSQPDGGYRAPLDELHLPD